MSLSVQVLGPLSAERSGVPIQLGGAKLRLLFGVLIAHRRSALTADQLGDALWGAGRSSRTRPSSCARPDTSWSCRMARWTPIASSA